VNGLSEVKYGGTPAFIRHGRLASSLSAFTAANAGAIPQAESTLGLRRNRFLRSPVFFQDNMSKNLDRFLCDNTLFRAWLSLLEAL
jgi:hypothetical protein